MTLRSPIDVDGVYLTPAFRNLFPKTGLEYVERNGWVRKRREYLDLVDTLSTESFEAPGEACDSLRV